MSPPPWTTSEQELFLFSFFPRYVEVSAGSRKGVKNLPRTELFNEVIIKWAIEFGSDFWEKYSDAERTTKNGVVKTPKEFCNDRIREWFHNRARSNARLRSAVPTVHAPTTLYDKPHRKRKVNFVFYEHFKEDERWDLGNKFQTAEDELKKEMGEANYNARKALFYGTWTSSAYAAAVAEDPSLEGVVKAIRDREYEEANRPAKLQYADNSTVTPEEALRRDRAFDLQSQVDAIPMTIEKFQKAVSKTGWVTLVLTAGPMPKEGGRVTMFTHMSGTAVDGGEFESRSVHLKALSDEFQVFAKSCFVPEELAELSLSGVECENVAVMGDTEDHIEDEPPSPPSPIIDPVLQLPPASDDASIVDTEGAGDPPSVAPLAALQEVEDVDSDIPDFAFTGVCANGLPLRDGLYIPASRLQHTIHNGSVIAYGVPHPPNTSNISQQQTNERAKNKAIFAYIKALAHQDAQARAIRDAEYSTRIRELQSATTATARAGSQVAAIPSHRLSPRPPLTSLPIPNPPGIAPPATGQALLKPAANATLTIQLDVPAFAALLEKAGVVVPAHAAKWFTRTGAYLLSAFGAHEKGAAVLKQWVEMELTLNFAKGETQDNTLMKKGMPTAIDDWCKTRQPLGDDLTQGIPRSTRPVDAFTASVFTWWNALQPEGRKEGPSSFFERNEGLEAWQWAARLWKAGPKGISVALVAMSWIIINHRVDQMDGLEIEENPDMSDPVDEIMTELLWVLTQLNMTCTVDHAGGRIAPPKSSTDGTGGRAKRHPHSSATVNTIQVAGKKRTADEKDTPRASSAKKRKA